MTTHALPTVTLDDGLRALSAAENKLMEQLLEGRIEAAAARICSADFLLVATGAGMSVGCGLTTYRSSEDGLPALRSGVHDEDGSEVPYELLASPTALSETPTMFYDFMCRFYNAARDAQPSTAYRTLRALLDLHFPGERGFVFTSNVDGMHIRAGFEGRVFECHGSKMRWQCAEPCQRRTWDLGSVKPDFRFPIGAEAAATAATAAAAAVATRVAGEAAAAGVAARVDAAADEAADAGAEAGDEANSPKRQRRLDDAAQRQLGDRVDASSCAVEAERFVESCAATGRPICPACGGPARPAVLLFGADDAALYEEPGQLDAWSAWRQATLDALVADRSKKLVIVEIGAGTAVPSVRNASEDLLQEAGARQCTLLRINPTPVTGDMSMAGVLSLKATAENAVEQIAARMRVLAREAVELGMG